MEKKYTDIGGQALIEGVMMRGKNCIAICVRKPNGEIETKTEKPSSLFKNKFFRLPFIRGMFALIDAMMIGVKAITYSAEIANPDEFEESKFEKWLESKFGEKGKKFFTGLSVLISLVISILLFGALPAMVTGFLKGTIKEFFYLSLIEGVIKLFLFVAYIFLISQMREIRRVFEYHGAEHKTIACYEAGLELTPENAKDMSRLHPRCGTSFLFYVMAISILLFSVVTWSSVLIRVILKVILLPVVAGISFEIIKTSAKYPNNLFFAALSKPGLMLQKLTTKEPDLDQLEVGIASMNAVLESQGIRKFSDEFES